MFWTTSPRRFPNVSIRLSLSFFMAGMCLTSTSNVFDPGQAGKGSHSIQYSVTTGNNCSETFTTKIRVDDCTGIGDLNILGAIKVYPNPFTNSLNIELTGLNNERIDISLTDVVGRTVLFESKDIYKGKNVINLKVRDNISTGFYVLEVRQSDHSFLFKLVMTD